MEKISIESFQKNFDNYIDRVENGESFLIQDKTGRLVSIVPSDCEVIKIHTEHNDAS
jgi:hypothetical protein